MEAEERKYTSSKGSGRSLIVSEFLYECHGRLHLTAEQQTLNPGVSSEAGKSIQPVKDEDWYWDNDDL